MMNKPLKPQSCQTDVMRGFYISEFEKDLENQGIDTVCFMGYGYNVSDVKVGADFYFSYLYYGRNSDIRKGTKEDCLRSVLIDNNSNNYSDRYKLIQKYKYFNCHAIDQKNSRIVPIRERREYVKIKNLRTNEISVMHKDTVSHSVYFCWVIW